jgi:flagellar biosynthetic protein FliR
MGGTEVLSSLALQIYGNIDRTFTFFLLVVRFSTALFLLPGLGSSARGIVIKYPLILMFALLSCITSPVVKLPTDLALMLGMFISEGMLGACLAAVPLVMIAAIQNAGQLASTSMGLQAGALMDPTTGTQISELSRILGDLAILAFLFVGGHHVILYGVSGLGGQFIPGTFLIGEATLDYYINATAAVFNYGLLFASPVVVALLLTNFVMGLVSKAVPTVNIFIISYPLTIGIGLILMMLMLPEVLRAFEPMLTSLESIVLVILQDAVQVSK